MQIFLPDPLNWVILFSGYALMKFTFENFDFSFFYKAELQSCIIYGTFRQLPL
jgi:hypothetical protein